MDTFLEAEAGWAARGHPEELSVLSREVKAYSKGQWIINLISMINWYFPMALSQELKQMRPPEE